MTQQAQLKTPGINKPETAGEMVRRILAETETFSREALGEYQRGQLAELLRFAQSHSPFYRERLKPLFTRNGDIDWRAWGSIPVLTREDIKAHGSTILTPELPPGHGEVHTTASSGTTGTPVTVHFSSLMLTAGTAAFARAARRYGQTDDDRYCVVVNQSEYKFLDPRTWAIETSDSGESSAAFAPARLAIDMNWAPDRILALMERHGSTCFSGYATVLEDVAEAQIERQSPVKLKFMVGTSMAITERGRSLARQAFNAPAFSAYTSKEAHKIAHECPVSGGFHVNSELVMVEILDDSGQPCGPGETGRVIVTPFLSTAQPLIRYEQGDLASWGGPCPCGRAHPLLVRIEGRIVNQFRFGDDRRLTPPIGHAPYRDLLKADKWQVAQTGPFNIEVRFVSSTPDEAIDFAGMTALFQKSYHPGLEVQFRRLAAIPLTAAGKFIPYVNEHETGREPAPRVPPAPLKMNS
ncbi:MAG: phenylacetate--CoA ligase family protein [Aestuariivirga sp.]